MACRLGRVGRHRARASCAIRAPLPEPRFSRVFPSVFYAAAVVAAALPAHPLPRSRSTSSAAASPARTAAGRERAGHRHVDLRQRRTAPRAPTGTAASPSPSRTATATTWSRSPRSASRQRRFEVKRVADEEILLADAALQPVGDAARRGAGHRRRASGEPATTRTPPTSAAPRSAPTPSNVAAAAARRPRGDGRLAPRRARSVPGRRRRPGRLLGPRPRRRPEPDDAQRHRASPATTCRATRRSPARSAPRRTTSRAAASAARSSTSARAPARTSSRARGACSARRRSCSGPTAPRARSASRRPNVSLGGRASGPIVFDKAFYNVSYQLGRSANDLQTLLNTDAVGPPGRRRLGRLGRAPLGILGQAQRADASSAACRGAGSATTAPSFGALDFTPPSSNSGQSLNVDVQRAAGTGRRRPARRSPSCPRTRGDRTSWNGGAAGAPHELLREHPPQRDDRSASAASRNVGHAVPRPAQRVGARELRVRRRHERRALPRRSAAARR